MKRSLVLAACLLLAGITPGRAQVTDSQAMEPVPQRYGGRIAALSGPAAGRTAYITIQVDRFATDAEVQALGKILADKGESALLEEVSNTEPCGWFKIGTGLRYSLRILRTMDTPDGRMLIGLTARPIDIREIVTDQRSLDYGFGWVQITFDENGVGQGELIPSAKVDFDADGRLVVESYDFRPMRLIKMKSEKVK